MYTPAVGQTTDHPALVRAIEVYDAGELQRALSALESDLGPLSPHDTAVRHLYLGLVRFALGEPGAARNEFARALRAEPSIRMDPDVHSPARLAAFEAARVGVVDEFRALALRADAAGDEDAALDRWRMLLEVEPADAQATSRVATLEAAQRQRAVEQRRPGEARGVERDSAAGRPVPPPSAGPDSAATGMPLRRHSPGQAFALGLLVPGLGQMYTGRRVLGLLAFGAAGGALVAGLVSERVEVDCGSIPVNNTCPPADVLDERTRRPYLAPAVAAAAGITLLGAVDALLAARRSGSPVSEPGASRTAPGDGFRVLPPALVVEGGSLRADLVRVRFR